MKTLSLLSAILLISVSISAQQSFFPTQEGTVLIYKTFDKKNKIVQSAKYTVKQVSKNGNDMEITYLIESNDAKDKLLYKDEVMVQQKNDIIYLDMSNFVNKAVFQQNGEIPAGLQIKGNNMELPRDPQTGQSLPDANIEMSFKLGFVNLRVASDITNRKVEGIEDISVNGETFECYKLSSQVNSSVLGVKTQSTTLEWYAKGIGTVKTESYDKKGELLSRTELVEVIR